MFEANNIADYFISQVNTDSGDTISHLKIQKLVYYAQAWHYTLFNKPLFEERIEAWRHGPVIRSIYERFKMFQVYLPINTEKIEIKEHGITGSSLNLLEDIVSVYSEHSASYLEDLTHSEDPWRIARGSLPIHASCDTEITLDSMKAFYSKFLNGSKTE